MFGSVTTETFDRLYAKLNAQQRRAVDTVEGPVMVIAGPGTGKTHMLTLRIANILRATDTSADSILALTFTESAVYSMRKRLVEIIGSSAYRVHIYTFHGFCNEVIRLYPESFERIIGSKNIGELEQIRLMERLIETVPLSLLRQYGNPFFYVRPSVHAIRDLKREDRSPGDLRTFIEKQEAAFHCIDDLYHTKGNYKGKMKGTYQKQLDRISRNKELLLLYEAYETVLARDHIYDYEDMILEVVRVLSKNSDLLLILQEQYQYILADEHQDANQAQNRLLELLASFHESPNLCIVGDGKQAIYRFQGASLDSFLYFKKRFPESVVVYLKENYRSTQALLSGAHTLIAKKKDADESIGEVLLSAGGEEGNRYEVRSFSRPDVEYFFIAKDIQEKIKRGIEPIEIAVLYRNNKDALPLIEALDREGIAHVVHSDQDVLKHEDIGKLLLLLRTVENVGDDELLAKTLFLDLWQIPSIVVYHALAIARKSKRTLYDVIGSRMLLTRAGIEEKDRQELRVLHDQLGSWCKIAHNRNMVSVLEIVIRESGFLANLLALPDSIERLHRLDAFWSEVKRLTFCNPELSLNDFISSVDLYHRYGISMNVRGSGAFLHGIQLMTAHKSKGLEFEHIYIVDAVDGHWGNKREQSFFDLALTHENSEMDADDDRRLFYVALTRARKGVTITYARENETGKHTLPSQFVEEIGASFRQEIPVSHVETHFEKEKIALQFQERRVSGISYCDRAYLNTLFLEQGLSVTALNNFLACPWRYFFDNLLRVRHAPSKHQYYGIAVHATLKHFFDAMLADDIWPKEKLIKAFERSMQDQPLGKIDLAQSLEKGIAALSGYFDHWGRGWKKPIATEKKITGIFLPVCDEEKEVSLLLRGVIDKVELLDDAAGVHVVDYKTGKQKSRNALEGNTKNSKGNEKRQLVFYKLLLDNFEEKSFHVVSGEIDFVEPDKKGRYRKECFSITDDDVAILKEEIQSAAKRILSLSFWNERCEDKKCPYCALAVLMQEKKNAPRVRTSGEERLGLETDHDQESFTVGYPISNIGE